MRCKGKREKSQFLHRREKPANDLYTAEVTGSTPVSPTTGIHRTLPFYGLWYAYTRIRIYTRANPGFTAFDTLGVRA